tara:strand:- start:293 stop:550 length:258 start_codon:yes stop_codon:yes gene_type:complete
MLPVGIGVSKLVVDFRLALRMGVPSAFRQGLDSDGEAAWVVGSIEKIVFALSCQSAASPSRRARASAMLASMAFSSGRIGSLVDS